MSTRRYPPPPHVGAHDPAQCDMCWQDLVGYLFLPPPPGRLPWRTRALSWWVGVGQPAWRRWARRVDKVVLFVTPLLMMTALLLAVAQDRPAPVSGSCTLVGSSWTCHPDAGTPYR